jgi:hypothetical protein
VEDAAPRPIWLVSLIGLLGFPIPAIIYAYGPAHLGELALNALVTWSAVVLGFLGGVRWGLESGRPTPRWTRLLASTVSPFVGWALFAARHALPTEWALTGFLAAFIVQWLFDQTAPDTPARYPRLTTILTLVACVSLAMALEKALRL